MSLGFAPTLGRIFTILSSEGLADTDGNFVGPGEGATLTTTSSRQFKVSYVGGSGNDVTLEAVNIGSVAVQKPVFYNNSKFDANLPGANAADDQAIAPDETALQPGEKAGPANVTNYSKGINGVMIDVADLPTGTPAASDFTFKVGKTSNPNDWADAPAPTTIRVRRGGGFNSSDRVTLVWPDGAIHDTYLQITFNANAASGLAAPEVFYFGNLIGDTDTTGASTLSVIAPDLVRTRNAIGLAGPITSRTDFDRNGTVGATDLVLCRNSIGHSLPLITPAGGSSPGLARAASAAWKTVDFSPFSLFQSRRKIVRDERLEA